MLTSNQRFHSHRPLNRRDKLIVNQMSSGYLDQHQIVTQHFLEDRKMTVFLALLAVTAKTALGLSSAILGNAKPINLLNYANTYLPSEKTPI